MAWQPSWNRWDQSSGWRDSHQQGHWQNRYEDYTSQDKSNLSLTLPTHVFQAPSSFTPDEQHLDTSQPVPLYRHVQATAWRDRHCRASYSPGTSQCNHTDGPPGMALRPLSQGKYTGVSFDSVSCGECDVCSFSAQSSCQTVDVEFHGREGVSRNNFQKRRFQTNTSRQKSSLILSRKKCCKPWKHTQVPGKETRMLRYKIWKKSFAVGRKKEQPRALNSRRRSQNQHPSQQRQALKNEQAQAAHPRIPTNDLEPWKWPLSRWRSHNKPFLQRPKRPWKTSSHGVQTCVPHSILHRPSSSTSLLKR